MIYRFKTSRAVPFGAACVFVFVLFTKNYKKLEVSDIAHSESRHPSQDLPASRCPTQELRIEVRIRDHVLCWALLGPDTVGVVKNNSLTGGIYIDTMPLDLEQEAQHYLHLLRQLVHGHTTT